MIDDSPRERRGSRTVPVPTFGELLVEFSWRPSDRPQVNALGWLISHGYAPDRRKR